ncbi:MAG: PaRep2a protein [Pyrobaculum sp.]
MKDLLDFLKEMSASAAPREVAKCRRVPLPEAFALPRRFGVSWGCLASGVFNGFDAVVVEVNVKGLHLRYKLPYDGRYIAEYRGREKREEKSWLPQYFADALYELAAKYAVEITDSYVLVGGVEVDSTVCYQRRTAEDCARAIERYVKKEWPKVLEQRRRREEERRREELRRQMAKAAVAEYGRWHEIPTDEYSLRRAFWWEGKWLGRPISCFVTDRRAYCTTDGKRAVFYVIDAPDGVYLRPEIKLFDELIKVVQRGDGL